VDSDQSGGHEAIDIGLGTDDIIVTRNHLINESNRTNGIVINSDAGARIVISENVLVGPVNPPAETNGINIHPPNSGFYGSIIIGNNLLSTFTNGLKVSGASNVFVAGNSFRGIANGSHNPVHETDGADGNVYAHNDMAGQPASSFLGAATLAYDNVGQSDYRSVGTGDSHATAVKQVSYVAAYISPGLVTPSTPASARVTTGTTSMCGASPTAPCICGTGSGTPCPKDAAGDTTSTKTFDTCSVGAGSNFGGRPITGAVQCWVFSDGSVDFNFTATMDYTPDAGVFTCECHSH
jgi:hypothetical protein